MSEASKPMTTETTDIPMIDGKCAICDGEHNPNQTLCPNAPTGKYPVTQLFPSPLSPLPEARIDVEALIKQHEGVLYICGDGDRWAAEVADNPEGVRAMSGRQQCGWCGVLAENIEAHMHDAHRDMLNDPAAPTVESASSPVFGEVDPEHLRDRPEGQREGTCEHNFDVSIWKECPFCPDAPAVATERAQERYPANGIGQPTPEQIRKAVAERNDPKNLVQQSGQGPATPSSPEARDTRRNETLWQITDELLTLQAENARLKVYTDKLGANLSLRAEEVDGLTDQLADLIAKVEQMRVKVDEHFEKQEPGTVQRLSAAILCAAFSDLFPVPTPEDK